MNKTRRFWQGFLLAATVTAVCWQLWAADTGAQTPVDSKTILSLPITPAVKTPEPAALEPGPYDGRIAQVVAMLLRQIHYSHHPLDNEFSERFYDRYLNTLDPQHLHFTAEDLAEFEHYRDHLDEMTISTVSTKLSGDVTPAFEIFKRFRQRLEQRVDFSVKELKEGKFDFTTDERMLINRKDAPYPKNLDDAKKLWLQRLRYDYLQEKLAKHGAKKKEEANAAKTNAATTTATQDITKSKPPATATKLVEKRTDAEQIVDTLSHRYERNIRLFRDWDHEDVLQVYLGALSHIYDPHTDYMNKLSADNFAIGMNNTLIGIGAELRSEDGFCTINRLIIGGPAERSKKLHEKDRIVGVAQGDGPVVDVVEMSLNKVVQMIRGQKSTEVRLTVQPANADASDRYVLSLIRDEIKLEDQAAKGKVIEIPNGTDNPTRLGVIDLPSFYAPIRMGADREAPVNNSEGPVYGRYTSVDVAAYLKKFKKEKVSGVVLDLRRNGGGLLDEAVKLTGLFIKSGPVVQVRDSDGRVYVDEDDDEGVAYDGPLVVLTSRFSASASEIFAGALQDYGRALIVGDQSTHGKGTVQNVNELGPIMRSTNDFGVLKVTFRKFYRASGASTQLKGVLPDIVLPSILSYSEDIGESALDNALKWDTIDSAKFDKLERVSPYLEELMRRSSVRLGTNQDFAYVREDIDLFRKNQADKSVSLNEAARLKEKEDAEARQKARDKERLTRKESTSKVYELTFKQLDLPGLPPPVQKTNSVAANSTKVIIDGAATNTVTATTAPAAAATVLEDGDDEPAPPVGDVTLEETEQILKDYINLLNQKNLATTRAAASRAD